MRAAMNKKFFITWALIFVVWMVGSFIVHAVLLQGDYMQLPNLFRTGKDSQQVFPFMILAHVIMAGAFVWIYLHGVGNKSWAGQGFRFGVAAALLMIVPIYLIYYAVQPMPGVLVMKQIIFDSVLVIVLGMTVSFLYRGHERS